MNGCLTGLVAITAGCATVDTWAAVVIGIFAGWFYLLGSNLLIKLRIDDAVDAIPVHMIGGAWGVISAGLFTNAGRLETAFGSDEHIGWFYEWGRGSGNFSLLGAQLISVLFIFGWTSVTMGAWFYGLKMLGWLRIDALEEMVGMDISYHKGVAYDINQPKQDLVDQLNESRSNRGMRHSSFRRSAAEEPAADAEADDAVPTQTDVPPPEAPIEA
jgi:Amt family ammonium transporter